MEHIRSCWWPDFNTLITLCYQQIKFEGIIIKIMWMCVDVFAWGSVCLLWGTCGVHGIICSNCFFLFHHMSPKSGVLRLSSSRFLTYRAISPAPGLRKLCLIFFFNGKTSICFPTLNLQLPRYHMMFNVSQVITSCFFFQLILQVSYYLSWTSTCCFFFWCLRKELEKKSHIFILLQNVICNFYHTTHAILTIDCVLKIYFTQVNTSTYVNQMMCKGNSGVVSNNTIETKVGPLLKIVAAQSSLPFH